MRSASNDKNKLAAPTRGGSARRAAAVAVGQRLHRIGSTEALHAFVLDAAQQLCAPRRVLLVRASPAGLQVAASRVPRGESAAALLAAVTPWLQDAGAQRAAALHIGPPGALPRRQRCCIVAPLRCGPALLGFLYGDVQGRPVPWSAAERDALARLAEDAALALDRLEQTQQFEARLAAQAAELNEARQQEAAANEVLKLISCSAFDLEAVLQTLVETATRLCDADKGTITRKRGEQLYRAESYGFSSEFMAAVRDLPVIVDRTTTTGRALLERKTVHVPDVRADPDFAFAQAMQLDPFGTALGTPLLRDGEPIGAIALVRKVARPFSERQIARLTVFADQAVIAIQNARLFNEAQEALEQQTATSAVLAAISSSPTNTEPVFAAISQSAMALFNGMNVAVGLVQGDARLDVVSWGGELLSAKGESVRDLFPVPVDRSTLMGQAILDRAVHSVDDLLAPSVPARARALAENFGYRSILAAPMLREGEPIGAIGVMRASAGAFSAKQASLLQTFADQAVIAIENARLFNETKASLEQQKASADILRVISSSVADTQPVFEKILDSCKHLFGGDELDVLLVDEQGMLQVAAYMGKARDTIMATFPAPVAGSAPGRAITERCVVHYADVLNNPDTPAVMRRMGQIVGYHSVAFAPMLWEERGIGVVGVARSRGAFIDKELALLQSFADQAVIAIQNARLFNETKEALERQTATANVLKAISRSTFDLPSVLDTLIGTAARLCRAAIGVIFKVEGDFCQAAGLFGATPALIEHLQAHPISLLDQSSVTSRAVAAGRAFQIEDTTDTSQYGRGDVRQVGGYRTLMGVPILREGVAVGVLTLGRTEVRAFDDKEIELVTSFADQAAIAMENVRLFNETKEALERQTATSEILKVIASSPQDVQPVFDAIAASSKRLIDGFSTTVFRIIDGVLQLVAFTPTTEAADEVLKAMFPRPIAEFPPFAMVRDGELAQIADTEADPSVPAMMRDLARLRGYRAMLFTPLLRDATVIGMIGVTRVAPGPFAEHHVRLLKTFADQAVIAIENVRLFNETQQALQRQTASADILRVISSSPTDVAPVLDAIVRTSLRLLASSRASVLLREGDTLRISATARAGQAQGWQAPPPIPIDAQHNFPSRVLLDKTMLHIADLSAIDLSEHERAVQERTGMRSSLLLPLLRENDAIGVLVVGRTEPGAYSEDQIALLRSFADQAVIAIENVRLFNETKEALERQTATAEILQRDRPAHRRMSSRSSKSLLSAP